MIMHPLEESILSLHFHFNLTFQTQNQTISHQGRMNCGNMGATS